MTRPALFAATVLALVVGPALSSGAGPTPTERVRALDPGAPAPSGLDRLAEPLPDGPSPAAPGSRLEPVEGIGPGSQLWIERPDGSYGCTANFVFESPDGDRYLGTAGHCLLPDDRRGTHGPMADFDAGRVHVEVAGGCPVEVYARFCTVAEGPAWRELGEVVYAQQLRDFGVIRIPEEHHDLIRPEMPEWGGPDGAAQPGEGENGETVLYYGHGIGTGQTVATRARAGVLADTAPKSTWWSATAPVFQGDSGSPVVLAADDASPLTGGAAFGVVTNLAVPGAAGPRIGPALADVLCWAGMDLRVVPNGSFLGGCPRAEVGTEGEYGTVLATDGSGDAHYNQWTDTSWADVERIWIDSDGSHVRFTFRIEDLQADQPRTRYYVNHWGSAGQSAPTWSVYCYSDGHGGVLSSPLECNGHPASWDVERDLIWAEIPYSEFGWESGETVGEVVGASAVAPPAWYRIDHFEGNGTHTLS